MVRYRLLISGRVQGVFFRDACRRQALAEGVDGWVHNRRDGAVEACFEGEADAVERMIEWCRRGPSGALVTRVDVIDEEPEGERGFRVG